MQSFNAKSRTSLKFAKKSFSSFLFFFPLHFFFSPIFFFNGTGKRGALKKNYCVISVFCFCFPFQELRYTHQQHQQHQRHPLGLDMTTLPPSLQRHNIYRLVVGPFSDLNIPRAFRLQVVSVRVVGLVAKAEFEVFERTHRECTFGNLFVFFKQKFAPKAF